MRCAKCGGEVTKFPMKNSDGVKGYCYYCNACHRNFWKSLDGSIIDSRKKVVILGVDMSKREVRKMTPKECLIQFKEAYCEKDPKNNKDPEFRCDECLFRQDNECLINAFISRQCAKED